MLEIKQFEFSHFGVNTYLAVDKATGDAAVIDAAMLSEKEKREFDSYLLDNSIHLTQIINTHLHLDHCFGTNYVKEHYGVPMKAHAADSTLGGIIKEQYMMFGMTPKSDNVTIDVNLADGDIINIGESQLLVIHTPGHTPGGICLYDKEDGILFAGDTLFRRSVGRTDLPGGNQAQLIQGIHNKLYKLPGETLVLPGHGPYTTIAEEKKFNPFS